MSRNIRLARVEDASGLNTVYNGFIRDSVATFETVEHSLEQRQSWMKNQLADPRHPVFVCEDRNGEILGFASASAFDPRGGYQTSVKVSVFVAPAGQGAGIGAALYGPLFSALAQTDIHRAYGLIVPPNPASVALHKRFGFAQVSRLHEVGRKFGRFLDVEWFEKRFE